MTSLIVAFAGTTASGKSTISTALAERLGWKRAGFGDYVRQIARERGVAQSIENLQDLGAELVAEGAEQFCRGVLEAVNWRAGEPVVVDGVRHLEVLATLRGLTAPSKIVLVFVTVGNAERFARLKERGINDTSRLARIESHSAERQVRDVLRSAADLVVDGSDPLDRTVATILGWLGQHR